MRKALYEEAVHVHPAVAYKWARFLALLGACTFSLTHICQFNLTLVYFYVAVLTFASFLLQLQNAARNRRAYRLAPGFINSAAEIDPLDPEGFLNDIKMMKKEIYQSLTPPEEKVTAWDRLKALFSLENICRAMLTGAVVVHLLRKHLLGVC